MLEEWCAPTTRRSSMSGTAVQSGRPQAHREAVRNGRSLHRLLKLEVPLSVVVAEREMPVESILAIRPGTFIEFEARFDSPLVLFVGDQPIGSGQAVKVGEHFGLRLQSIDTVRGRIEAMGRH